MSETSEIKNLGLVALRRLKAILDAAFAKKLDKPSAGASGDVLKYNDSGVPSWSALTKSDVGLGNVENTAFYKRNCFVNGATVAMAGTVATDGFTIYAPTNHGGQDGLILTSKMLSTPVWTAPSSITVGKATQLANTRKIWGQNFNGTGNVDGDLTANGNINAIGGGVSAKGIADFTLTDGTQNKDRQTVRFTMGSGTEYTITHTLATTDVAVFVFAKHPTDNYEMMWGGQTGQGGAYSVRYQIANNNQIKLQFRTTNYAPASGTTVKVVIIKL